MKGGDEEEWQGGKFKVKCYFRGKLLLEKWSTLTPSESEGILGAHFAVCMTNLRIPGALQFQRHTFSIPILDCQWSYALFNAERAQGTLLDMVMGMVGRLWERCWRWRGLSAVLDEENADRDDDQCNYSREETTCARLILLWSFSLTWNSNHFTQIWIILPHAKRILSVSFFVLCPNLGRCDFTTVPCG